MTKFFVKAFIVSFLFGLFVCFAGSAWDQEAEYNSNVTSEYTQRLEDRAFENSINK